MRNLDTLKEMKIQDCMFQEMKEKKFNKEEIEKLTKTLGNEKAEEVLLDMILEKIGDLEVVDLKIYKNLDDIRECLKNPEDSNAKIFKDSDYKDDIYNVLLLEDVESEEYKDFNELIDSDIKSDLINEFIICKMKGNIVDISKKASNPDVLATLGLIFKDNNLNWEGTMPAFLYTEVIDEEEVLVMCSYGGTEIDCLNFGDYLYSCSYDFGYNEIEYYTNILSELAEEVLA